MLWGRNQPVYEVSSFLIGTFSRFEIFGYIFIGIFFFVLYVFTGLSHIIPIKFSSYTTASGIGYLDRMQTARVHGVIFEENSRYGRTWMRKNKKCPQGHYCKICGQYKPWCKCHEIKVEAIENRTVLKKRKPEYCVSEPAFLLLR